MTTGKPRSSCCRIGKSEELSGFPSRFTKTVLIQLCMAAYVVLALAGIPVVPGIVFLLLHLAV
jgi:hypothetical protein